MAETTKSLIIKQVLDKGSLFAFLVICLYFFVPMARDIVKADAEMRHGVVVTLQNISTANVQIANTQQEQTRVLMAIQEDVEALRSNNNKAASMPFAAQ